jgi:dolichol kinase
MNEIDRQLAHLNIGLLMLATLWLFGQVWAAAAAFSLLLGFMLLSYYAKHHAKKSGTLSCALWSLLSLFERRGANHFEGAIWYSAGLLLPLSILPYPEQAAAAVFILAVGDSASTLFGLHGKRKLPYNPKKTMLGTFAFFVFSSISVAIAGWMALVASAVCALVESLELGIDDNITVSLAATALLFAL